MRVTAHWAAAAIVSVLGVVCPASQARGEPLDREVNSLAVQARLGQASIGASNTDIATGERLATHNARAALAPASNLKVITSGAALMVLGKDFAFRTNLHREGDTLVIVGGGDPALADPKLLARMGISLEQFLDRIVASVRDAGFTGIREVVVDDRIFDRETVHPTWPKNQLNKWYCAPVGGLNFHTNVLEIYPAAAGKAGEAPSVRTVPSARWVEVVNRARTVKSGGTSLWAAQDAAPAGVGGVEVPAEFRFSLHGEINAAPEEPIEVTVREPGLMLARLLADRLGRAGMGVAGSTPGVRRVGDSEPAANGPVVASIATPIAEVLERCNTDSQNLYAEALLKRLAFSVTGQPGSFSGGATVVRMQLNEKLGPEASELVMVDGSGLSKDNRVSAAMLASWLALLHQDAGIGPMFIKSMATSTEGRLRQRFKDERLTGEVRAKTGYIAGVLCLTGYVSIPSNGRTAAFSILVNNYSDSGATRVKDFHDNVVVAIDRWLAKQPALAAPAPALGG